MRACVISDTHGDSRRVIEYLKKNKTYFDEIWHLGDFASDAEEISKQIDLPLKIVKGNCDMYASYPEAIKLVIESQTILLCHGHRHHVKTNLMHLFYFAVEEKVDVVCFGHTHVPINEHEDEILFFNPGSASLPRAGYRPSIGIIELSDRGVFASHVILEH